MKQKIIVIGGGFGGLATAALLAKQGHIVTLLEKNADLGGRARVWKDKGFVFDMGPSWYMMPDAFEHYFSLFGKKPEDFYELKRLDPAYRLFFGTKPHDKLDIPGDRKKVEALFESIEPGAGQQLSNYLDEAEKKYEISMGEILYTNYTSFTDFIKPKLFSAARNLKLFGSLEKHVNKHFKNERLRKALAYTMVFLGGSPKNTPALYSVINHSDINQGIWYPMGGFGAVVQAITRLATEHGVTIKTASPVEKILVEKNQVTGVQLVSGEVLPADAIIANADYAHVEMNLLPQEQQSYTPDYWNSRTLAPSAFLLYIGVKKKLPQLLHHNLYLDEDWTKHFNAIFDAPDWPKEPSYYICCPSKTDPAVAPSDGENLFVLVPIASGLTETSDTRKHYRDKIVKHLEIVLGESIEADIVTERIFSVSDFKQDYNAFKGNALGLSHTMLQTALLRPAMQSKKVQNLHYVGQFTQPGIGVPMVLISAEITAKKFA